ncbi:MAG TPA: hypothetical protein VEL11_18115 [Candidatus Bathyarchaeia archaeon]|nr:hypothetical protein [Candidatus Bathyarchaeia archaeon]
MQEGPYKFSQDEIRDLFGESFKIDSIRETVYQGIGSVSKGIICCYDKLTAYSIVLE